MKIKQYDIDVEYIMIGFCCCVVLSILSVIVVSFF